MYDKERTVSSEPFCERVSRCFDWRELLVIVRHTHLIVRDVYRFAISFHFVPQILFGHYRVWLEWCIHTFCRYLVEL